MIDRRLLRRLLPLAARYRRFWFTFSCAMQLLVLALIGWLLLDVVPRGNWQPSWIPYALLSLSLAAFTTAFLISRRFTRDLRYAAQRIEARYRDLDSRLLTAMEQEPYGASGMYNYLQETVIREAVQHSFSHDWISVLSRRRAAVSHLAFIMAIGLLAAITWRWATLPAPAADSTSTSVALALGTPLDVTVEPGDIDIERGSSLLITARFADAIPSDVTLVAVEQSGDRRISMQRSLEDPLFGARLEHIAAPLRYRVTYEGGQSRDFQIQVFDFPRLERADAELQFPEYTKLSDKHISDVRRVTAVEGTQLTLSCLVNKPVREAALVDENGGRIPLQPADGDEPRYVVTLTLDDSQRYVLDLQDQEGRSQKPPAPEFTIHVTRNQPAELKWVAPARDLRASPLEEIQLAGSVQDDYGVVQYGLLYSRPGEDAREVVLGQQIAGSQQQNFQHLLELESLEAEPDELLTYYLWAEDLGPDSQPRRVFSDMYFAEVRHFEEIFREGQSPPGGQSPPVGGQQQAAEELAELQKQIINGTWNLLRREQRNSPSPQLAGDAEVLRDSQLTALEQLIALRERLQDSDSLQHAEEARGFMETASGQLTEASKGDAAPLPAALSAAQSAYQALLRLRAREHEIVRSSQNSSSSSGSGSRSQQQLQQLELQNDPSRYETERTATPPEDEAQREVRQALNRLRELAQRQNDLNERLKELQAALEQAETEEERQELERQLKRLRDEQQQVLRDTEELQQRLQQSSSQQSMNQEQQQLEQTRENVRQASEALEQGQLSQALTSGTRAEEQFRNLQEQFRQRSASQFQDEMEEMRREAQELENNQQQMQQQLDDIVQNESRSLRESPERRQLQDGLQQQTGRIDELLESMRSVVERAEQSEPLLSRRLYDTFRQAQQDQPQQSLQQASQWIEQGFPEQAREPQSRAGEGVRRLAAGVEDAARSVLGDEAEALRRARDELDRLTQQLAEEMNRHDPNAPSEQPAPATPQPGRADQVPPDEQQAATPGGNSQDPMPGDPSQTDPSQNNSSPNNPSQANQSSPGAAQGDPSSPMPSPSQASDGQSSNAGESPGGESPGGQSPGGESPMPSQSGAPPSPSTPSDSQGSPQPAAGNQPNQSGGQPAGGQRGGTTGGDEDGLGGLADLLRQVDQQSAPLTGQDFMDWSDRLRDVEEMLQDPAMRARAAQVRDRARDARIEYKRHSQLPEWDLVRERIYEPLLELRREIAEELRRKEGDLGTVDRDPVPGELEEHVRRYYERLGSGQR